MIKKKIKFIDKIKHFFRGLGESFSVEAKNVKKGYDTIFMFFFFGDTIGVPHTKTYFSMSMLPYLFKEIDSWKKKSLREKDITDRIAH